jgi:hypothetical protein
MLEQLHVTIPPERTDPFLEPDEAFKLVESYVIEAERQIRGIERGPERFKAVLAAVMRAIEFPDEGRETAAAVMVQMVYTSIAIHLPDHMRLSKTHPPAPPREEEP